MWQNLGNMICKIQYVFKYQKYKTALSGEWENLFRTVTPVKNNMTIVT